MPSAPETWSSISYAGASQPSARSRRAIIVVARSRSHRRRRHSHHDARHVILQQQPPRCAFTSRMTSKPAHLRPNLSQKSPHRGMTPPRHQHVLTPFAAITATRRRHARHRIIASAFRHNREMLANPDKSSIKRQAAPTPSVHLIVGPRGGASLLHQWRSTFIMIIMPNNSFIASIFKPRRWLRWNPSLDADRRLLECRATRFRDDAGFAEMPLSARHAASTAAVANSLQHGIAAISWPAVSGRSATASDGGDGTSLDFSYDYRPGEFRVCA